MTVVVASGDTAGVVIKPASVITSDETVGLCQSASSSSSNDANNSIDALKVVE
jgi:hypothetical protein